MDREPRFPGVHMTSQQDQRRSVGLQNMLLKIALCPNMKIKQMFLLRHPFRGHHPAISRRGLRGTALPGTRALLPSNSSECLGFCSQKLDHWHANLPTSAPYAPKFQAFRKTYPKQQHPPKINLNIA